MSALSLPIPGAGQQMERRLRKSVRVVVVISQTNSRINGGMYKGDAVLQKYFNQCLDVFPSGPPHAPKGYLNNTKKTVNG
jgi:hypothetical protein